MAPLLACATALAASVAVGAIAGATQPAQPTIQAEAAEVPDGGVTLVPIHGPLDWGMLSLVRRAVERARDVGGPLVLELDTPGGEVELMERLATAIDDAGAEVRTVAWVRDRALSAGALLALSCELVYMREHGTIGAAMPVTIGPAGLAPLPEDDGVREKLSASLRGRFRGMAERHGRSGALAEAMVDAEVGVRQVRLDGEVRLVSLVEWDDLLERGERVELLRTVVDVGSLLVLTGSEAVGLGIADGIADDEGELADKLGHADGALERVLPSTSESLAGGLHTFAPVLLLLALLFAWLEFKAPGFGLFGILSIASFALLFFGRWMVGLADVPHLVLVTVGVVLIAVEVFLVPGTTWVGGVGLVATFFGLGWSLFGGSDLDYGVGRRVVVDEAFRFVLAGVVAFGGVLLLSRVLPRAPGFARLVLAEPDGVHAPGAAMPEARGAHAAVARAGAAGRALTALRPVGKVVLDDDPKLEFEARAEGEEIAAGSRVVVAEVGPSGRLVVSARDEVG